MTQLFLHIGPHKTGSTFIQKVFFDNREHLLALGVNYPNLGFGGQYGQHEVVEKIRSLSQNQLDLYVEQIINGNVNFVSSENFDRLKAPEIKRLQRSLSEVDVKIIYFFRNYVDMLPSWWQEEVKHGSTIAFHDFVLPHILRPFSSNIVNPRIVLDLYANVFGKENIKIFDYSAALERGSVVIPVLEQLGVELPRIENISINASLKFELIEIIRALNAIAKFNGKLNAHNIRALFLRKKNAREICDDVEHLAAAIRDQMKSLRLSGSFFEGSVISAFRKEYDECCPHNLRERSPEREFCVPSDTWMLQLDSRDILERIYRHLITGEVIY